METKLINNYRKDSFQKILAWLAFLPPIFICIYFYLFGLTFIQCLFLYLILHLISVIPLQVYLNKKNRWERNKTSGPYQIFLISHPMLFKLGSFAIVYPYIFVFLLFWLRYNRLGQQVSIEISFFLLILIILFLVIVISNFSTFLLIWNLFSGVKNYFWEKTTLFGTFIYLYMLKNNILLLVFLKCKACYYYISQIIHLKAEIYYKISPRNYDKPYVPGKKRVILLDWELDPKKDVSFLRRFLFFVYLHPVFFPIILFIFLFLEIVFTFKIYYFFLSYIIILYVI